MAMDYVLSLAAEVGSVDDKSIKAAQKIVQNYFDSKKIELDFTTKATGKGLGTAMKTIQNGVNAAYANTVKKIKVAQEEIDKALSQGRTGDVLSLSTDLKKLQLDLENVKNTAHETGIKLRDVGEIDVSAGSLSTKLKTESVVIKNLEDALNSLSAAKQKYFQQQMTTDEAPERSKKAHQELTDIYRQEVKEAEEVVREQLEVAKQHGLGEKAAERYTKSIKNTNRELEKYQKKQEAAKLSQKTFVDGLKDGLNMFTGYQLGLRAVQAAVQLLVRAFNDAIETIKELNGYMTEVQMVAMTSNEETAELADSYSKLAKQLGATTKEIAEGSVEWLRQGKTLEEVESLMEATMTMSKVGAISAGDATEYLTSTLNGYKMSAQDAMDIVDKMSAVDLAAATSVEELALALQKTANMARTTGVELDEIIGMIATVSEVTRQAPEIIGTSFKTLFSRMTQVAAGKEIDDAGEKLNDVETTLNRAGIALRSSQNDWRDMYDVLNDVAGKWKELDDTQRAQIATALGGTRQKEIVLALMENWDRVAKYVKISEQSTGSATEKMQYYLESIEAATKRLKATWEEFIYSKGTVKFITGIINLATSLLDVLNKIGNWFAKFGWTSEDFKKEADDTQSKIQDNIDRINEINAMSWQDKTSKIIEEKKALEEENAELERNLKLQREKEMSSLKKEISKGFGAEVTSKASGETTRLDAEDFEKFRGSAPVENYQIKVLGAEDAIKEYQELIRMVEESNSITEEQQEKIDAVNNTYEHTIAKLKAMKEAYDNGVAGSVELSEEQRTLIQISNDLITALNNKRQAMNEAEQALVSNARKLIENEKDADKARAALTEFVKTEIILNSSKLDLSQQIRELKAVAEAAGAATTAIGALGTVQSVIKGGQPFFQYNGKLYRSQQEALSDYWSDLSGLTKPGNYFADSTGGSGGSGSSDPNAGLKKAAQNQIKLLNKMKDKLNGIIDDINKKWDDEADALEKANDKLEQQIEYQKLLEAMAKAKTQKKMIYKDGRFQYLEDTEAISKAQSDLDEFYRKKDLQDQKDYIEEQRKLELGDLEDQVKYLEDKVNYWNDYIDRLDAEFSSYMDIFDDFLKKQKEGYFSDLEALKKYVEEKEALAKRSAAASAAAMSGGGYGGATAQNPSTGAPEKLPIGAGAANAAIIGASGVLNTLNKNNTPKRGAGGPKGAVRSKYAEGTTNAKGGMSVVGERGAELRVLNRGDGIIPADITKNLWKWGAIDPERIKTGSTGNIENYNIDVDNVNLPDVTNPEEFISGIRNLALQRAYNR
nr:MAG TPA: minor tail protein [Caudoviricetes sp.]